MTDRRQPTETDPLISNAAAAITQTLVPTLKAANKYGIAQLIALVCVGYLLFMNYRQAVAAKEPDPQTRQQLELQMKQIETTNQMLRQHMDAQAVSTVVSYLTCIQITKLTGDMAAACSVPGSLK